MVVLESLTIIMLKQSMENKTMGFNKRGQKTNTTAMLAVVALFALVGLVALMAFRMDFGISGGEPDIEKAETAGEVAALAELAKQEILDEQQDPTQSELCLADSSSKKIDFTGNILDIMATSETYLAGTIYFQELNAETGEAQKLVTQALTATASPTANANILECGREYNMYFRSDQDALNGMPYPINLEPRKNGDRFHTQGDVDVAGQLRGSTSTFGLSARLWDPDDRDWVLSNLSGHGTGSAGGNTASDWLNANQSFNWHSTGGNTSLKTTSARDIVTAEISLRTGAGDIESGTGREDGAFGAGYVLGLDYTNSSDNSEWDDTKFRLSAKGVWFKTDTREITTLQGMFASGVHFIEFTPSNNDDNALEGAGANIGDGPDLFYAAVDENNNPVTVGGAEAVVVFEGQRDDTNSDGDLHFFHLGSGVFINEDTAGIDYDLLGLDKQTFFRDDTTDTRIQNSVQSLTSWSLD